MKGSIDITVLIVAIVPMMLLLVFAAFFIAEEGVRTDLNAEVAFDEKSYQVMAAHSALMTNETRRKIGMYEFQDSSTQERWQNELSTHADNVLGSYSDYYEFRALGGDISHRSEKEGSGIIFATYVASPSKEMKRARTAMDFARGEGN